MFSNFFKLLCKEINNHLKFETINNISENDCNKVKTYLNKLIIDKIYDENSVIGYIEKKFK